MSSKHLPLPPRYGRNFKSYSREFLDQIRRALFAYLSPEFARAWRRGDRFEGDYSFDIPADIRDPLALGMYWDLMNRMRDGVGFPAFTVSPYLKNTF